MNQVSINVGILFTQLLSLKWSNDNDWRWLLITAGIIAAINVIVLTIWVDESPMWLVNQGNHDQAYTVLHRLRGEAILELQPKLMVGRLMTNLLRKAIP